MLLTLVVVHGELDQVHFFKDFEVHVDYFFAEKLALNELSQFFFSHDCLEVLKNFPQLEWVPLLEVLGES